MNESDGRLGFIPAPIPGNDAERVAYLRALGILDTPAEKTFDEIARLASAICGTPIALVSLLDESRQWFKARHGLDAPETPRTQAFCGYAILGADIFEVEDSLQDERFAGNPLVTGGPKIRFYAGVPLETSEGYKLGTLCVLDAKPRELTDAQRDALRILARQASTLLEMHKLVGDVARTAAACRESELRTRAILEHMLSGLLTIDERSIIRSINPAAEQLFGYDAEEMVGESLEMLMPDDIADKQAFLRLARERSLGRITEWTGRRKDGTTFPFELSMFSFPTSEGMQLAGSIRDVSERRAVEQVKREFVSTVSHELRTPLTSIRGSLGLILAGVMGEVPGEVRHLIEIAERNSTRLIALINDILDIERLENGRLEMQVAVVDAARLLRRSVESIQSFAAEHDVVIRVDANPDVRLQVDEDRMLQVLVNLLSNAIKFSPRGSTVDLTAALEPQGEIVEICVKDRGRGIPREALGRIFERFQQVDASDAKQKGGAGLGLAITRAIVDQHGGTIEVESEEGRGSTFRVRLPAIVGEETTSSPDNPSVIVLIEDDDGLIEIIRHQLAPVTSSIRSERTAREGVAAVRASNADLLILDVGLPDGDGFDVVALLRDDPATAQLPLLVYSARELSADDRARLQLGPTRFLLKSRERQGELAEIVAMLLGRSARGVQSPTE
jgi:PAS domain S-box-containing protein